MIIGNQPPAPLLLFNVELEHWNRILEIEYWDTVKFVLALLLRLFTAYKNNKKRWSGNVDWRELSLSPPTFQRHFNLIDSWFLSFLKKKKWISTETNKKIKILKKLGKRCVKLSKNFSFLSDFVSFCFPSN